jgi:hypothetical protein
VPLYEIRKIVRRLDAATARTPKAQFKRVLSSKSLAEIKRHNREDESKKRQITNYETVVRYGSPHMIDDLRRKLTSANQYTS